MDKVLGPILRYANTLETKDSYLNVLKREGVTNLPKLKAERREDKLGGATDKVLRRYLLEEDLEEEARMVSQEGDTEEDLLALLAHLKDIGKWIDDAQECLEKKQCWEEHKPDAHLFCLCEPCVEKTAEEDFTCLCSRATLLRDHFWGAIPRIRNYAYLYTPLLWCISSLNRLLRIRLLGAGCPELVANTVAGKGFPIPQRQRQEPVSEWEPETVYEALQLLVWAHSTGEVEVGPALQLYWEALQDRMAVLTHEPFVHKRLEPNGILWECYTDNAEVEDALQDDAEQALSRQIRDHVDSEIKRVRKEALEAGEEVAEGAEEHVSLTT